jgi:hypothetical protein
VLPPEPVCGSQADCNDGSNSNSNSTCGPDPAEAGVRRCFCNSPLVWNPVEGVCVESKLDFILFLFLTDISQVECSG